VLINWDDVCPNINLKKGCQAKICGFGNASVMGSSYINVSLYPSLEKRGKGRFSRHNFKIPLYPPLPKGDKNTGYWGVTGFDKFASLQIEWSPSELQ
jgi:hypothetical protein